MKKTDDRVFEIQKILRRTLTGRELDPDGEAMVLLHQWRALRGNRRVECGNCGFIFFENYFVNGCPNCHAREPNDIGG